MTCRYRFLWIAAPLLLVSASRVGAWEADVHFGLTKWLALQVGFSKDEAQWIAKGNQGIDDSAITGPMHTTIWACLRRDISGSREVHNHHFPSKADPPNSPANRKVTPSEVWYQSNLSPLPAIKSGDRGSFDTLGGYLHALQDTWSHQGEPDIPFWGTTACDPQYGWGHAKNRGGWACHTADYTHVWQQTDVLPMAKATYDALASANGGTARTAWSALIPRISAFAAAQTKDEKAAWFDSENIQDLEFLSGTSLPNCAATAKSCQYYPDIILAQAWPKVVADIRSRNPPAAATSNPTFEVPDQFVRLFDRFFDALVSQNVSLIRKELIDEEAVANAYSRAMRIPGACRPLFDSLSELILGAGFVDSRGATQPPQLCTAVSRLGEAGQSALSCADAIKAVTGVFVELAPRGGNLSNVTKMIGAAKPYVYSAARLQGGESYAAIAAFAHLPRDELAVEAAMVRGAPKITSLIWAPKE